MTRDSAVVESRDQVPLPISVALSLYAVQR